MQKKRADGTTTVFFDGGCPLCSREIAHYRRLDAEGQVRWTDITRDSEALSSYGLSYVDAMERLHVVGSDGGIRTGAYAFVALWHELPYWRVLARVVEALHLTACIDVMYNAFARWRFARRCRDGTCGVGPETEVPERS